MLVFCFNFYDPEFALKVNTQPMDFFASNRVNYLKNAYTYFLKSWITLKNIGFFFNFFFNLINFLIIFRSSVCLQFQICFSNQNMIIQKLLLYPGN